MSCTKKVRRECSCGGTGTIKRHIEGGVIKRDSRGWPTYGESRWVDVSCPCGRSGYYYETEEDHDWGQEHRSMSSVWKICRKCGAKWVWLD